MAQIIIDTLVKMRLGFTDDEILDPKNLILAGGDDVLQTFENEIDFSKYRETAAALGIEISDFKRHDNFDGCSFFSHTFHKNRDQIWQYIPERFTKHIENLRRTTIDDLPMALASHMINYCWDREKFAFFERMFKHFRRTHPHLFTLNLLKTQAYLRYKSKGLECADM